MVEKICKRGRFWAGSDEDETETMLDTETLPKHRSQDTLQSQNVALNVCYTWPASTDSKLSLIPARCRRTDNLLWLNATWADVAQNVLRNAQSNQSAMTDKDSHETDQGGDMKTHVSRSQETRHVHVSRLHLWLLLPELPKWQSLYLDYPDGVFDPHGIVKDFPRPQEVTYALKMVTAPV